MGLLRRTRDLDLQATRDAAASRPTDLQAQLDVADLDVLGGKIEDAFGRLLDLLPGSSAEDKETLRRRLVDYFEILGPADPRVGKARQLLAINLY